MSGRVQHAAELPPSLPPRDAWKVNPDTLQGFHVPTDDRKFVLPDATIEKVLSLFEDEYEWPVDWSKNAPQILRPDDHHFHWLASSYRKQLFPGEHMSVPAQFRDLPTNRGILPRQFHNVLHKYTLPPDVPDLEHMVHYLESFEIARQLFRSAERTLRVDGLRNQAQTEADLRRYEQRYDEIFATYRKVKRKALGTQALQVIGENDVNVESLPEVIERLGSCALLNTPNYTTKYFDTESVAA